MAALLQHLKGFLASFGLILANAAGDTQTTVDIQHG
jgi:hypothetical protein